MNKSDFEGISTVVDKMRELEIQKKRYSELVNQMKIQFGEKASDPKTTAEIKVALKTNNATAISVNVYDFVEVLKKHESRIDDRLNRCQEYFSKIEVVFADSKK